MGRKFIKTWWTLNKLFKNLYVCSIYFTYMEAELDRMLTSDMSASINFIHTMFRKRENFGFFLSFKINCKWFHSFTYNLNLKMKIVENETKTKIKNPLHTKDLLKFKINGRDGTQWFLIRIRLIFSNNNFSSIWIGFFIRWIYWKHEII